MTDDVPLREHLQRQIDTLTRVVADLDRKADTHLLRSDFDTQHQRLIDQVRIDLTHLRDRIDAVEGRLDRSEGRGLGLNSGWVYLLGGITALGALVSMGTLLYHLTK